MEFKWGVINIVSQQRFETIEEIYPFYLQQRNSNQLKTAYTLRARLMNLLFKEQVGLLSNEMFLDLLEHVEEELRHTEQPNTSTRNVLTISRALQYHRGLRNRSKSQVNYIMQILLEKNKRFFK